MRPLPRLVISALFCLLVLSPSVEAGELHAEGVTVHYHPAVAGRAVEMQRLVSLCRERVEEGLGLRFSRSVRVELPQDVRAFEARYVELFHRHPPEWVQAVASPRRRLIVICVPRLNRFEGGGIAGTLMHELAHVLLAEVEDRGAFLPRWLHEGLAMWAAGEGVSAEERARLRGAASRDTLIPLSELERSFPPHTARAHRAYLQSLSVVEHLAEVHGRGLPRRLLARMWAGEPYLVALERETGQTPAQLEQAWRDALEKEHSILEELFLSLPFFGFLSLLVVVAWWRMRRQNAQRLAEMDEEDLLSTADSGWLGAER